MIARFQPVESDAVCCFVVTDAIVPSEGSAYQSAGIKLEHFELGRKDNIVQETTGWSLDVCVVILEAGRP